MSFSDSDAADALIAGITLEMDELRAATYEGRDASGLAIATVDGHGMIVKVRFARGVARHDPVAVGDAVRDAVTAAQQRLAEAYVRAAEQDGHHDDGR